MCPRGLREIFNQTCRNDDWASSVSFRGLESSMSKRMKIQQPKIQSNVQEFDTLTRYTHSAVIASRNLS